MAVEYLPVAMTGGGGYEFRIAREVTPQSGGTLVAATIQWRRTGSVGQGSSNQNAPYSLNIGGDVKSSTRNFNAPAGGPIDWQWIESHSVLFVSGSSTFITASFNTDTTAAGSGTINNWTTPLSTASKPSFNPASPFPAGSPVTINMNRQNPAFTHDVAYAFEGGTSVVIGTNVGASTSWTPPLTLLNQIPNAVEGSGIVGVNTWNGAAGVGYANTPFKLTAPASVKPTCSGVTVADQTSAVASIVGKPVQGLSRLKLTVNGAGIYGSTILSADATLQGVQVASGGEVAVTAAGNVPISASVTDTRGRVGTWASTLAVLAYEQPKLTGPLLVRRANTAGTQQNDGTFLRVDPPAAIKSLINGTERNSGTIRVSTRERGSTGPFTPRNVITFGITYSSWFLISGGGIFAANKSFDVLIAVEDKFSSVVFAVPVGTAKSVFHVTSTGQVAVGKRHEQGALDVGPGGIYDDGNRVINASNVASEAADGVVRRATQAQADAGADDTRYLTSKKVRDRAYAPWAMAGGRGTSSATAAVTVTFPSGRFSQAPLVAVLPAVHTNVLVPRLASGVTATSFQVQLFTMPGGALVANGFDWTAVQMAAGSASG